jgi:nucleotide-binding universal stress UspA family protein
MLEKVLLATDGSKDAALAARAAVEVCQGTGAELHVVHAWHSVPTARFRPFMRAELKKLGNELLERVMNLDEHRIEMRIPRSDWFLRDLRFPHS